MSRVLCFSYAKALMLCKFGRFSSQVVWAACLVYIFPGQYLYFSFSLETNVSHISYGRMSVCMRVYVMCCKCLYVWKSGFKATLTCCFCYCTFNGMSFNQFFNVENLVISQAESQTLNYSGNQGKPIGGINLSAFRFMRKKGF